MDLADKTEAKVEILLKAQMSHINTKKEVPYTGECLWCGEPTKDGRRWCSIDCRDVWEKFNNKF